MVCTGLCEYFHTYKTFAINRTYETHKQCTRCEHIVPKDEYPDLYCYCCAAKYRDKFPTSKITRKKARQRKKIKQLIESLSFQ